MRTFARWLLSVPHRQSHNFSLAITCTFSFPNTYTQMRNDSAWERYAISFYFYFFVFCNTESERILDSERPSRVLRTLEHIADFSNTQNQVYLKFNFIRACVYLREHERMCVCVLAYVWTCVCVHTIIGDWMSLWCKQDMFMNKAFRLAKR